MKASIPAYLVALAVTFVYAVIHYYVPDLPLTEEQVRWVFDLILAALGLDVVTALKRQGIVR